MNRASVESPQGHDDGALYASDCLPTGGSGWQTTPTMTA